MSLTSTETLNASLSSPVLDFYEGLDFANQSEREGRAFLSDDGTSLTLSFEPPTESAITSVGVDCPFGTSAAFVSLLSGVFPTTSEDRTFQSRSTECWVRNEVGKKYQTCKLWDASARREHDRNYFHPTTHVQPAVAMRIVPNCLAWMIRQVPDGVSVNEFFLAARRAEGRVVESHPRMFLYSMIERVHRHDAKAVTTQVLNAVAGYKNKGKFSHQARREAVYHFLRDHTGWTGNKPRKLEPEKPDELLFVSDHAFDAWLSALTAWANHHEQCIRWTEAGIAAEAVNVEGHILLLRQKEGS